MQPSEALSASAQISVTLAGFAGVVVAFRTRSVHEWTKIDKFRLQILLSNSALPFLLSIFAMVLSATKLSDQIIWRLCSLIAFVLTAATGQLLSHIYRAFSRDELKTSGSRPWIFYSSGLVGIAVTVLQIYNIILLQTFWPFFAMIATWLCLAMVQFVLLVTARHDQNHGS
ncbi:MAG TPA: hypothetical protein VMO75_02705 [Chthoniobacterales bacterium]|nr:hypothetical protein [Chthoniobacterales bacterium]